MKKSAAIVLQGLIVLTGAGMAALMLWEPHLEGRNANATTFDIYFHDPFLAYAYAASIAFFVALYQAFRLAGYLGRGRLFSSQAVRALRTIRYCAMALTAFVAAAVAYMFIAVRGKDDIAGGVAIALAMILMSIAGAAVAAALERALQRKLELR